jgi:hypothetical protein
MREIDKVIEKEGAQWWLRWFPLIAFAIVNGGSLIYGASTLSNELKHLSQIVSEIRNDYATKKDLSSELLLLREREATQNEKIAELKSRLSLLEVKK